MENELSILVSWLISFIGIGITALLGVNLWASLSINKRINKKIKSEVKILRDQNEKLKDQLKSYSQAIGERTIGDQHVRIGATTTAFIHYLNSLQYSSATGDKKLISDNLDSCIQIIRATPSEIIEDETILNNLQIIKDILLKFHDERSYELYSYFVSLSNHGNSQSHQESQLSKENE